MIPFELVEPATLKEAIAAIDPDDPAVRPIAGGTALMLMMKAGVFTPRKLVSLRKLDGMSGIKTAGGELMIGALTPLSDVEHSADVARHAPVIPHIMTRLSNVRVRNVATVGGALAHGDPHMDLPPVAIALGAACASPAHGRARAGGRGSAHRLLRDRAEGQRIDRKLHIPPQGKMRAAYFKVTAGSADDWPALGVAVALETEGVRSNRRAWW